MSDASPVKIEQEDEFARWLHDLSGRLDLARQRLILSIQGDTHYCDQRLHSLLLIFEDALILSDRDMGCGELAYASVETLLGRESSLVVVDLFDGLNPDVLCIAAGLVSCGGMLVLLSPGPQDWTSIEDRYGIWQDEVKSPQALFAEYLFNSLSEQSEAGIHLVQGEGLPSLAKFAQAHPTPIVGGKTPEQSSLMAQIDAWLADTNQSVALITADRGRGKSSCLGMIYSDLVVDRQLSVLVTAPSRQSAAILMMQAKRHSKAALDVNFAAPDRIIAEQLSADVLIIDEAAMLPYPMLQALCRRNRKLIMATTTGGYEGTGQGFLLRFVARLDQSRLRRFSLSAPVRWAEGDCLEAWLLSSLLLRPTADLTPFDVTDRKRCRYRLVDGQDFRDSPELLKRVYSLLVSAHYRSRPSDLRMLMENPQLLIVLAEVDENIVGVALLNLEGGLDRDICHQVYLGTRRPRGHLLAQMISAQAGDEYFACHRGIRVQRIAVVESWRRRGVGRQLIDSAVAHARSRGLAYIGASFALDAETAAFWKFCGMDLIHIGFGAGKSSGNHSVAVVKSLSQEIDASILCLQARIDKFLPLWLCQFLQDMDAHSVVALLQFCAFKAALSPMDLTELRAFTDGHKGFELCFGSLQLFTMQAIAGLPEDTKIHPWLIEKAIQNRPWKHLYRYAETGGRKQAQKQLRQLVKPLLPA